MTDYNTYIRKPFPVQAIEITKENIAEFAPQIGELDYKDGDPNQPYIQVDRRKVPSVYRVWPGYFLTKMGDNVRCYSPKVFQKEFVENSVEIQEWVDYLKGSNLPDAQELPQPAADIPDNQPTTDVEVSPGVTVGQREIEVHIFDRNDVEEAGMKAIQHASEMGNTPKL